ncbi:MAG: asparagine--tRNA ligase [Chloroflexi bacterium]|nr:asparagine--tRNA ligase [Chloroflexota bacterium]
MDPSPTIAEIASFAGKEITLKGWLYQKTDKGKLQFLLLRDGTGIMQCVVLENEVPASVYAAARKVTPESSLILRGTVRPDKRAPGGYELAVHGLEVVHLAQEYPIAPKEHGIDFLLDHRHLWIRTPRQMAILRVRAEVIRAAREWLDNNGFVLVDTPILTPAAVEGTTTLFEVKYFEDIAYLTQSGQLYNEADIMAFGKVYCFGPTFRAERSKTRRHLLEFWMVEPEMAFVELEEMMGIEEEFVTHIVRQVLARRGGDLETIGRDPRKLQKIGPHFPRVHYDEAVEMVRKKGEEMAWGDDFGAPQETILSQGFDQPFFVHHYPEKCKAFYMEPDPQRPELSLSADLLAPEGYGEIIGGGQRISDLKILEKRIAEQNLPRQAFEWYLDLRRYGSVPHSGFGLGIERTVAWICGLKHIREAIPFPRTLYRLYP